MNNDNNNNKTSKIIDFNPNNLIPGVELNYQETKKEEDSLNNSEEKKDEKDSSNNGLIEFNSNNLIPGVDLSYKADENIETKKEEEKSSNDETKEDDNKEEEIDLDKEIDLSTKDNTINFNPYALRTEETPEEKEESKDTKKKTETNKTKSDEEKKLTDNETNKEENDNKEPGFIDSFVNSLLNDDDEEDKNNNTDDNNNNEKKEEEDNLFNNFIKNLVNNSTNNNPEENNKNETIQKNESEIEEEKEITNQEPEIKKSEEISSQDKEIKEKVIKKPKEKKDNEIIKEDFTLNNPLNELLNDKKEEKEEKEEVNDKKDEEPKENAFTKFLNNLFNNKDESTKENKITENKEESEDNKELKTENNESNKEEDNNLFDNFVKNQTNKNTNTPEKKKEEKSNEESKESNSSTNKSINIKDIKPVKTESKENNGFVYALHGEGEIEENVIEEKPKDDTPILDPNDEEYMRAYIGNNYDKIATSKFSIPAFLLGELYYFYRKMFIFGVIIFIVRLILMLIFPPLAIIINILLGIFTNKIYLYYAQTNIDSFKLYNKDNISLKCQTKGGTNIIYIIGAIIAEILITIILIIILTSMGISISLLTMLSSIKFTNNTKYNGVLSYKTDIVMNKIIEVSFPNEFKQSTKASEYEYQYEYIMKDKKASSSCEFELNAVDNYKSSSKLLNEMADFNDVKNTIGKIKINGTNWDTFVTDTGFGTSYYYITAKNNNVYIMKYEIGSNTDKAKCEKFKTQIINTVKFK